MATELTLTQLSEKFETLVKEFPKERRKLMNTSGDKIKDQVQANIAALGSKNGRLMKAVTKAVGSGGGYAAVRNDWFIAPHAHLVEHGHWMIGKDGRMLTLKNGGSWVAGRKMYEKALMSLQDELISDAEKTLESVVKKTFG